VPKCEADFRNQATSTTLSYAMDAAVCFLFHVSGRCTSSSIPIWLSSGCRQVGVLRGCRTLVSGDNGGAFNPVWLVQPASARHLHKEHLLAICWLGNCVLQGLGRLAKLHDLNCADKRHL
jgi:hypothetical protein